MTVYVLLMENGSVHSVWSSVEAMEDALATHLPSAFDERTWQIAAGTVDRSQMCRHDTVEYVRSLRAITA